MILPLPPQVLTTGTSAGRQPESAISSIGGQSLMSYMSANLCSKPVVTSSGSRSNSVRCARTLHPQAQAQGLHIDFKPDEERFPLVSFIWMVDEFRGNNGATQFVPGSHTWSAVPRELTNDLLAEYENQTVKACGQAGSVIIFNGSVLHGHSANATDTPRRSIQGAFIPRDAQAGTDFSTRMHPETRARIGSLARYILATQ
jgi:ectoine hydroxylase-related dioxygenase (phytanoyl-CoA dioxygenase family)